MIENSDKITSASGICVILLRELRTERNVHQAQIADYIGKTPSAWTKVEAGKSPLQFETFLKVCNAMQVAASSVLATAERYAALLSQNGWAILTVEGSLEEDQLLSKAQQYWSSPGGRNQAVTRFGFWSVLNGPTYNLDGTSIIAPVFQFALDPEFQKLQLLPPVNISNPQSPLGSYSF